MSQKKIKNTNIGNKIVFMKLFVIILYICYVYNASDYTCLSNLEIKVIQYVFSQVPSTHLLHAFVFYLFVFIIGIVVTNDT